MNCNGLASRCTIGAIGRSHGKDRSSTRIYVAYQTWTSLVAVQPLCPNMLALKDVESYRLVTHRIMQKNTCISFLHSRMSKTFVSLSSTLIPKSIKKAPIDARYLL